MSNPTKDLEVYFPVHILLRREFVRPRYLSSVDLQHPLHDAIVVLQNTQEYEMVKDFVSRAESASSHVRARTAARF